MTQTRGKPFNEVCREIDELIGNTFRRESIPKTSNAGSLRKRVLSKFAKLAPLRDLLELIILMRAAFTSFLKRLSGLTKRNATEGRFFSRCILSPLMTKENFAICTELCWTVIGKLS